MSTTTEKETRGFETEVKQLLHLMIHSLYSHKEIFLRELISNGSDAADKLRFAALNDNALYGSDHELKIRVSFDKDNKTITIADNGIGMSREEAIAHLGTIAKSGTKEFLSHLSGDKAKDAHLIGQFGVGFYSAFMVADKVTVKTRRADLAADQGVLWTSAGDGEYSIENTEIPNRGTEVILHLKKDEGEFLDDWRLRSIITKYSDHISIPVEMKTVAMDKKDADAKEEQPEYETINRAKALWTLPRTEIKDEDYQEFYKHIAHDFEDPLVWSHNRVEGRQQYTNLLYIPGQAPFNLWDRDAKHGLKLYVKRVFIMDDAEQFLPRYLRFIKGVIDSSDLPLNISREMLQDNPLIEKIRAANSKKVLSMLEKLAKDEPEKFKKFWAAFGQVLKEGVIEDSANRDSVAKVLRFASTHNNNSEQNVALADYVARMKEGQDKIFYITGETYNSAAFSPHLEIFKQKGIEVLLLTDKIDEWVVTHLAEFSGKKLQSVAKGDLDLGNLEDEAVKEEHKKAEDEFESFIKQVKEALGDRIKDARITHRLTDSPACIVADEFDMGGQMQRILKAAGQDLPAGKPIFEVNPKHPLIVRLKAESDDDKFARWASILFEEAVLSEGGHLDDPVNFVKRLNTLLLDLTVA